MHLAWVTFNTLVSCLGATLVFCADTTSMLCPDIIFGALSKVEYSGLSPDTVMGLCLATISVPSAGITSVVFPNVHSCFLQAVSRYFEQILFRVTKHY